MEGHLKIDNVLSTILTCFGVITGAMSTLDNVEQVGRIVLLFISICSMILIIAVNWSNAMIQFKKWTTKDVSSDIEKK